MLYKPGFHPSLGLASCFSVTGTSFAFGSDIAAVAVSGSAGDERRLNGKGFLFPNKIEYIDTSDDLNDDLIIE